MFTSVIFWKYGSILIELWSVDEHTKCSWFIIITQDFNYEFVLNVYGQQISITPLTKKMWLNNPSRLKHFWNRPFFSVWLSGLPRLRIICLQHIQVKLTYTVQSGVCTYIYILYGTRMFDAINASPVSFANDYQDSSWWSFAAFTTCKQFLNLNTTPSHGKLQQWWCSITHVAYSWLSLLLLFVLCLRLKILPECSTESLVLWWLSGLICLPWEMVMCYQERVKYTKSFGCMDWKHIISCQNK